MKLVARFLFESIGHTRILGVFNWFDRAWKWRYTCGEFANSRVPPDATAKENGNFSSWSLDQMRYAKPTCFKLLTQPRRLDAYRDRDSAGRKNSTRSAIVASTRKISTSDKPLWSYALFFMEWPD